MVGAKVKQTLDVVCTHFVDVGKSGDPAKELKLLAKAPQVVCPLWLTECEKSRQRQAESLFPFCRSESLVLTAIAKPASPARGLLWHVFHLRFDVCSDGCGQGREHCRS